MIGTLITKEAWISFIIWHTLYTVADPGAKNRQRINIDHYVSILLYSVHTFHHNMINDENPEI